MMTVLTGLLHSYNRYLAVASRVVRRSLKEDKRIQAERRGEMDLKFAKWEVRTNRDDSREEGGKRRAHLLKGGRHRTTANASLHRAASSRK
jgi:hypothetical protein